MQGWAKLLDGRSESACVDGLTNPASRGGRPLEPASAHFFRHPLDKRDRYRKYIHMITKSGSGVQTGADQAGWRAADACGIPTGGWMSFGFLTEEGTRRHFANLCGAKEMPKKSYPARTVQESDGTIWFGTTGTPGVKTIAFYACLVS